MDCGPVFFCGFACNSEPEEASSRRAFALVEMKQRHLEVGAVMKQVSVDANAVNRIGSDWLPSQFSRWCGSSVARDFPRRNFGIGFTAIELFERFLVLRLLLGSILCDET